jgi:hypothetical protein
MMGWWSTRRALLRAAVVAVAAAVVLVVAAASPPTPAAPRRSGRWSVGFLGGRPRTRWAAGAGAAAPAGGPLRVVQVQYEEVDKRNFHGVLDRIRDVGSQATFWSLDTEFTGTCVVGMGAGAQVLAQARAH